MGSLLISHHPGHHQQNVKPQAYKQKLFLGSRCLPSFCYHFSKFNEVSVCVCKDATSATKANSEADVPNEEKRGQGGW